MLNCKGSSHPGDPLFLPLDISFNLKKLYGNKKGKKEEMAVIALISHDIDSIAPISWGHA